ncbi:MAG: hypothetical protein Ct9H300mP22_6310 [Gammaproteobacteria bacterium]|nr:MAG: hypothetical protein Ct9H300mP22_6310 [Gammaproteobacteria bacterium]
MGLSKSRRTRQIISPWSVTPFPSLSESIKFKAKSILPDGANCFGKTGMAVELVQRFPFAIINVDSVQVYRGMDIGTGKPDKATLSRAPID